MGGYLLSAGKKRADLYRTHRVDTVDLGIDLIPNNYRASFADTNADTFP